MRIALHRPAVRKPGLLLLSLLATGLVLIVHEHSRVAFDEPPPGSRRIPINNKNNNNNKEMDPAHAPGHMGEPFTLPQDIDRVLPAVQQQLVDGWRRHGYNQLASDLISVHRELPDLREPWCRRPRRHSTRPLPPVSVVIVFHDEALSALFRTVHSVLNRSPPELVQEIVLVDDWSSSVQLKTFLDDYFLPYAGTVRILRTPQRYGLIRARVFGARQATADYLVFLDAHCECLAGWLEPLLLEVLVTHAEKPTVAVPTIDWLNETTLGLQRGLSSGLYGAFDWNLSFQWRPRYDRKGYRKEDQNSLEPFDTPVMAGGLFCIEKAFFARLGWYDPGLQVYGGENMELSFKVWMCGGRIKIVPCSHVSHIQKRNHPYIGNYDRERELTMKNTLRVAEVWMDEYAEHLYRLHPDYRALLLLAANESSPSSTNSLTGRKRLRSQQLSCHSFSWYLEQVFPEQDDPAQAQAMGWLRNGHGRCLNWPMRDRSLAVLGCHGLGGQQIWFFYELGRITREGHCLQANNRAQDPTVTVALCAAEGDPSFPQQTWHYRRETGQLEHEATGRCLEVATVGSFRPTVGQCTSNGTAGQRWTFQIQEKL